MAYQRSDRGLFVATVGWQTEWECQHAGRIFSVQLSLKRLTAQEHKASDARFYSTVEHWLIFFVRTEKQCSADHGNAFFSTHTYGINEE